MSNQAFKFYGDPVAKTYDTMRTVKQIWCLNALSRQGHDVDGICKELFGCDVPDLSIKSASALISYLKGAQ